MKQRHYGRWALVQKAGVTVVTFSIPKPEGTPDHLTEARLQDKDKIFDLRNITVTEVEGQMTFLTSDEVIMSDVIEA
jgi:hypothetical protein